MTALLLALGLWLVAADAAAFTDNPDSPHYMRTKDGSADASKCGFCHQDDLSLSSSKRETCELCHGGVMHSGAPQHLAATAAAVSRLLSARSGDAEALPLDDEGRIYCGTCHLFHDPVVMDEQGLPPRQPRRSPLAAAVERAADEKLEAIEQEHSAAGAAEPALLRTRALRLPVDDGALCVHCHGDKR